MIWNYRQFIARYALIGVVLLAIVLRLGILLTFPNVFAFEETGEIHGQMSYDSYAVNLLELGIYGQEVSIPDTGLPPLYGFSLAIVYQLLGRGSLQVGIFQTLLDVGTILMLVQIVQRLFKTHPQRKWLATLSALFYAMYPYVIFQNLTLIDTAIWIFILHAFILLMIILREQEQWNRRTIGISILGGVVLGLSLLTRPILPPFAILVALWFLFRLNLKQTILRLAPVAIVGAVVITPWIVRNYRVFDAFVPMTSTSGGNLWQGNNEWTVPIFRAGYDVQWTPIVYNPLRDEDFLAYDDWLFEEALTYWRENPEQLAELFWVKFLVHWSIDIAPRYNLQAGEQLQLSEAGTLLIVDTGQDAVGIEPALRAYETPLFDQIGRTVHRLYYGGLFLLALFGIFLSAKQWREVSLIWFLQIAMTVVYLIFHPSTRYRVPGDPLLFVFSAYTIIWVWQKVQQRRVISI